MEVPLHPSHVLLGNTLQAADVQAVVPEVGKLDTNRVGIGLDLVLVLLVSFAGDFGQASDAIDDSLSETEFTKFRVGNAAVFDHVVAESDALKFFISVLKQVHDREGMKNVGISTLIELSRMAIGSQDQHLGEQFTFFQSSHDGHLK